MEQLEFGDPLTLARTEDPDTSHEAAEVAVMTLTEKREIALRCITLTPGLTQRELGCRYSAGGDSRQIGRRCNELEKMNLIRRGEKRRDHVTNLNAYTWWPRFILETSNEHNETS